jgi:hypothetical protein
MAGGDVCRLKARPSLRWAKNGLGATKLTVPPLALYSER